MSISPSGSLTREQFEGIFHNSALIFVSFCSLNLDLFCLNAYSSSGHVNLSESVQRKHPKPKAETTTTTTTSATTTTTATTSTKPEKTKDKSEKKSDKSKKPEAQPETKPGNSFVPLSTLLLLFFSFFLIIISCCRGYR